jgi:hypothetical protein
LVSYVEAWEKQNLDGKQLPKHAAPKQSTLLKKFFSIERPLLQQQYFPDRFGEGRAHD